MGYSLRVGEAEEARSKHRHIVGTTLQRCYV
jgi:hypothetical protein